MSASIISSFTLNNRNMHKHLSLSPVALTSFMLLLSFVAWSCRNVFFGGSLCEKVFLIQNRLKSFRGHISFGKFGTLVRLLFEAEPWNFPEEFEIVFHKLEMCSGKFLVCLQQQGGAAEGSAWWMFANRTGIQQSVICRWQFMEDVVSINITNTWDKQRSRALWYTII